MPAIGPLFDSIAMVDWSAANQPRQGRDSIWLCWRGPDGDMIENPRTRHAATALLSELLARATTRGERVLLGFDFPFGYPSGFAARLGLSGSPWRAVWDEIARLIKDDSRNRNNRFCVAANLNERISKGRFPFWGCPAGKAGPFLSATFHRAHDLDSLAERRLIDGRAYMPGAQPCWKLCYTGSVGSQSLTGIPVVRQLRDDPRWQAGARIWPFETGLAATTGAQVIFAEVYPSLWKHGDEQPKDKAQVCEVVRRFAAWDRKGELARLFKGDPGLDPDQRRRVETEEAWTLGVTKPRPPRVPSPIAAPHPCPLPASGARGDGRQAQYAYLRDPDAIRERSFALVRQEADLRRFPASLHSLALRLAHAAGDTSILGDLAWSRGAVAAGRAALAAGAPILVDSQMVAAGITQIGNPVLCTLDDPEVPGLATRLKTTRSAAAVELWRPHLAGAVVAIGNAPTALFHLLEMLMAGAAPPAVILGFPVGFVGAAEAKAALAGFGHGLAYITVHGRRGGSALAAAAVNALARPR
jgi:precorrin-8X/cobalt-precorrin-8 methylmutase